MVQRQTGTLPRGMDVTFTRFVAALRNAEVRASPAETLDAFDILQRVGVRDRALLRDALSMALAKTKEEKSRFEDTFERFFLQLAFREPAKRTFLRGVRPRDLLDRLDGRVGTDLLTTLEHVLADDRDRLALRVQQAADAAGVLEMRSLREKSRAAERIGRALAIDELDAALGAGQGGLDGDDQTLLRYLRQYMRQQIRDYVDGQYRLHVDPTGKRALLEAALTSNLDQLPVAYREEVRRVVEKLAQRLARDHRRRRKRARRGVLDIKRTVRRNVAYDGAIFDLRWRRQVREKPTVYVLCDVSSSVARVARFLLLLLYELTDLLPNIRAFAFSSRLGEVTDVFESKPSEEAIEEALFTWGKGNTDYARAFLDFRELCGGDLDRRSTLIVLGDGRNNYYDPRADLFEELTRRCRQTFWLNPESRDQWREGDSEMRRYAPRCTSVTTCNRISDIERFADRLLASTV